MRQAMRHAVIWALALLVWTPYWLAGQQDVPPGAITPTAVTTYPPFPNGMRVVVGSGSVLVRNAPNISATCGTDNHVCTSADAQVPNTYGVVQPDPPVLDSGGTFYWLRVTFDTGPTGWVSASGPDRLASLSPPQMIAGVDFAIVADYSGPVLTQATCNIDGLMSAATLQMQPITGGQAGTLLCPIKAPGIGNHKAVLQAINNAGTAASPEFQFSVTMVAIPQPPQPPGNLRIGPLSSSTATQGADTAKPTAKPAK